MMKRSIWIVALLSACVNFLSAEETSVSAESAFTDIYQRGVWGRAADGTASSGGGSSFHAAREYMAFMQKFLKDKNIKSVVDLGCGDWQFSRYIDWSGITYTGIDVVAEVVERNKKLFATPTISFSQIDAINSDLPAADLLICKDVMQHLTNEDILMLQKQFSKYKYCLITNDVDPDTISSQNLPLYGRGGYRTLDLTKPPFNFPATKVLTYQADVLKQVVCIGPNY